MQINNNKNEADFSLELMKTRSQNKDITKAPKQNKNYQLST